MMNKKGVATFELALMIVSLFAFSYIIYESNPQFEQSIKEYEAEKAKQKSNILSNLASRFVNQTRKPLIPFASAITSEEIEQIKKYGGLLEESETKTTAVISSTFSGSGCCGITPSGTKCMTTVGSECSEHFAENALCSATSFCQKGCCYDAALGIYDKNVLKVDCPKSWVDDPNCNMPAAAFGCCVLGKMTLFETQKQCEIDTLSRALGSNSVVDWRSNINEAACLLLAETQKEGACVIGETCKFLTESQCLGFSGDFHENYLCTSESLNTDCEKTELTICVPGKDQVYFLDSCGNPANIYDSSKVTDQNYWEKVIPIGESCGSTNIESGNANSKTCGNCNRFFGGICSSAVTDKFNVDKGDNYCKPTSCTFGGVDYKNGESWCVYDGAIGDGNDVVGSRHWKYVCNYGVVQVEPCADYRNQICIQQNTFNVGDTEVDFKNAACVVNNWRECITLNSEDDGLEKCKDTLNCRIDRVDIADKFNFDVCVPKYPGGFAIKDQRFQETAAQICGMATQTCTVMYKQSASGSCRVAANGGCLKEGFAQEMNDWCRSLGDCGLEANINGQYTENYKVVKSPKLSQTWISKLVALAKPVQGQIAEVEDYSEYLAAAGIMNLTTPTSEDDEGIDFNTIGMGVAGIGYALGYIATGSFALSGLTATTATYTYGVGWSSTPVSPLAPFAAVAIGAGIGMMVGSYLAKSLGLSPIGSILMTVGFGMVGTYIAASYFNVVLLSNPLTFWIGIALIVISLFFGGSKCKPVEVKFECKPWQPPTGGADCETCNDDPLKPCSQYRCESLGAACTLINRGTENEMCINENPNDSTPPIITPAEQVALDGTKYSEISSQGFSLTNQNGCCLEAYMPLSFGITTNEPAVCKFDMQLLPFDEMGEYLGGNYYSKNHLTVFNLPDPSHGQSQGLEWSSDLNLYIKCQDVHGIETPTYYTVKMCVNQGEDVTAPMIRTTNPLNKTIVSYSKTSESVTFVTNELATCKWDTTDKNYADMANEMECLDEFEAPTNTQGYVCNTTLPTSSAQNIYYIRCMDQPWLIGTENESKRVSNSQSYVYNLRKPLSPIQIDFIEPSTDFKSPTEITTVNLKVVTSNGGDYHYCSYSFSGYEKMIRMFETGDSRTHTQSLNLPSKDQKIFLKCEDETKDFAQNITEFKITYDSSTPQVARLWQESGTMYFITNEFSECKYSQENCYFGWEEGQIAGTGYTHDISVSKGNTYYIKCKDEFGNVPSGCSIEARAL